MTTHSVYPMVLNGKYIGLIGLRSDQQKYFDIPDPTPAEKAFVNYKGEIKAHTRNRFPNRLDSATFVGTPTQVGKKTGISRQRGKDVNSRGGKPIKIPTELRSVPQTAPTSDPGATVVPGGSIRFTTIKFPGAANIGEISAWLNQKCVGSHKPTYFKSPAGRSYAVAALAAGAIVTGPDTTP